MALLLQLGLLALLLLCWLFALGFVAGIADSVVVVAVAGFAGAVPDEIAGPILKLGWLTLLL